MSVLKQNKIEEVKCDLHSSDGRFLWTIESQLELNDVRIQIKEKSLEDYYLIFNDNDGIQHRIEINKSGQLSNWPQGFYDTWEWQMYRLSKGEW